MDRRKVLKNIVAALSLPLIPLGLISKPERISTAGVTIDPEKAKAIEQADKDAAILKDMYPKGWRCVDEKHHKRILRHG